MQNRPEGCIFQHSCTQRFTKSGTVSLGRKLARVPVTMLWVGTSSPNIHKIIKGSNLSFEMSDDKGHNLSWRFIYFRKSRDEIFMARDSVIFLLQHLGFAINLKKCVLDAVQEMEFLGLIGNSQTTTLSLPEKKIVKIKDQCLSLYKAAEVSLQRYHFFQPFKQCSQPIYSFASYNNSKFYL